MTVIPTPTGPLEPTHPKRAGPVPPGVLTDRDICVLDFLARYRELRREQLQRALFPSLATANKRLRWLYQQGLVGRTFLPVLHGSSQAVYALERKGAERLAAQRQVDPDALEWRSSRTERSPFFLEHRLAINDVRLAFELTAQKAAHSLAWQPEPACHHRFPVWDPEKRQERRFFLGPDAYARTTGPDGAVAFFLEVDRGTEGHRRLVDKVQTYLSLSASGQYQAHYAPEGSKAFRVLFVVTTGEQRLRNIKTVLERSTDRLVWLSLLSSVVSQDVLYDPFWLRVGQPGRFPFLRRPGKILSPSEDTEGRAFPHSVEGLPRASGPESGLLVSGKDR